MLTDPERSPVFFDCEASGLDGYPIEIGWAFFDHSARVIVSESHLIRPPDEWVDDGYWDPVAEELHGIGLEDLQRVGRSVADVAGRMNTTLLRRELFSDSAWDAGWLQKIFDSAGCEMTFQVSSTDAYWLIQALESTRGLSTDAYSEKVFMVEANTPMQHRAEADALHLASIWYDVWSRK